MSACAATVAETSPPGPTPTPLPAAVCGGLRIAIEGALRCDRIVDIAVDHLTGTMPGHVARGITGIEVRLVQCPEGEVPPQVDCQAADFAQMATVEFGPAPGGAVAEPSMTVAVHPVTGRVLGVVNPLIR